jgi:hypothetical protein
LLQQRIAGINGKVVFGFAFTGKFHSGDLMAVNKRGIIAYSPAARD